jgi:hypothetical protein
MELPPILRIPGLVLVEMDVDKRGRPYQKFIVENNDVREVTIYMSTKGPIQWLFEYSIWDATTRTVVSYKGKYGDPDRDKRTEIRAK